MLREVSILQLVVLLCLPKWINADDIPQDGMEIAHVLRHNRALLEGLPRYTCLETISRQQKGPKQRSPRELDTVQVDVGVGGGQEIYSWPGQKSFSSADLTQLVGQGFLGTGTFDTFARNVFLSNAAAVKRSGEGPSIEGRHATRFTYRIPPMFAAWKVNWLGVQATVGQAGDFWIDDTDRTLMKLRATAQDLPPALPLSEMTVAMEYRTLMAGGKAVLVPQSAELTAIEWNGTLHRDIIGFSQCRVFEAESSLVASADSLPKAMEQYESRREELPGGLTIPIALNGELRLNNMRVGDQVPAHLTKPVKISQSVTIPSGAFLEGRIRTIQAVEQVTNTVQTGIAFDQIEWSGHTGVFAGDILAIQDLPGLSQFLSRNSSHFSGMAVTTENIRPIEMPGVATFFLTGSHVIPNGFRMTWRTRRLRHRQR